MERPMEGETNYGFIQQDEENPEPQRLKNIVPPGNTRKNTNELQIGISGNQSTENSCFKRNIPLNSSKTNTKESLNEITVPKENDSEVAHDSIEENRNGIPSHIKEKRFMSWYNSKYRKIAHNIFIVLLNCCIIAYFIATIIFWNKQGDCDLDWCDGLGMLILILGFTYFGLLYYYVIKKHLGKIVYIKCLKPIKRRWETLMKHMYIRIPIYLLPLVAALVYLGIDTAGNSERLISCLGMVVLLLLGFLFSKHPRKVKWKPVFWGLGIQFLLGLIAIRWEVGRNIFQCIGDKVAQFLAYTDEGARFVYGNTLVDDDKIFAFKSLSVIFFLSFFVQILYYYGAMQAVVIKLGWLLQSLMGTTVCESVNAAASIFLGMSESPLLVKPYLKDLTKSELHAVMTGGFATVAGTVLAAYIGFGVLPAHLITASVMSAPAALCYAKLFYPETEESKNKSDNVIVEKGDETSVLDAATKGAFAAIQLVLGIIANIIAFVSFIAFLNGLLSWLGILVGVEGLTFEYILGKVFIPLAWLMGVDSSECEEVARLIGLKTIVNEFVAYKELGELKNANKISARAEMIATYALCGFSNPGSIGISIGALATMAPNQRSAVTEVAFRAFFAGCATCFLTACIAGMLMPNDYYNIMERNELPLFNTSAVMP